MARRKETAGPVDSQAMSLLPLTPAEAPEAVLDAVGHFEGSSNLMEQGMAAGSSETPSAPAQAGPPVEAASDLTEHLGVAAASSDLPEQQGLAAAAFSVRAAASHHLHWTSVTCRNCSSVCGQFKLDPSPGRRDKETWHVRVKLPSGNWPSKGRGYTRRVTSAVGIGIDSTFCRTWVHDNRNCCV